MLNKVKSGVSEPAPNEQFSLRSPKQLVLYLYMRSNAIKDILYSYT